MNVEIVVPFRGGCLHRERAWAWIQDRYRKVHPDWRITEAAAPAGVWSKGAATSPAIERSRAEIIVQGDADCWTAGLADAVAAVAAGAAWAIPHFKVHRLSEASSEAVLGGADFEGQPLVQRPYCGVEGGGFIVARRGVLLAAPIDSRFKGWGQADESQALALNALYGKPWRGTADLWHLFHPPQERMSRRRGSPESWQLRARYAHCKNDPAAMAALIEESRVDRETDEAGHDPSPSRVR